MRRALVLVGLVAAACSQARVQTTAVAVTGPLPAPSQVVVGDFTIAPAQVELDSGVGAQLRREVAGEPASATQAQAAQEAQAALGETLAKQLGSYGMPVARLPASAAPLPGTLLVQGQITAIDQGNRTRRLVIGFGAGASSMSANAQLYYVTAAQPPRFLTSFTASTDSGRKPGAAATMGAGAAAQRAAQSAAATAATSTAAERRRTDEEGLADKLADGLARQIGDYAVSQGWISQAALH